MDNVREPIPMKRGTNDMDSKEVFFYGKHLTLQKADFARRPDEEPPMILLVTYLNLPCPLGQFDEQSGQIETCDHGLQIVLELAPCAVVCPYCFGLMFVDEAAHSARYHGADLEWPLDDGQTLFGYATCPNHSAQHDLYNKIHRFTAGRRVLVAVRLDRELEQMVGISEGRVSKFPSSCTEEDLNSLLPKPSALAEFICRSSLMAYQNGRFCEAVGLAQRALVIEPECAEAHFLAGAASDELGMIDSAISEYKAALRMNPRFAEAYNNLGLIYYNQGWLDDAGHEYQAALRVNPDSADAHFNLGQVYFRQRRWDEAAREYQSALRTKPDYAEAHHNLGVIYHQQGFLDYAVREWQIALRLGYEPARQWLAQAGML